MPRERKFPAVALPVNTGGLITAPFQFALSPDDGLRVTSWSFLSAVTVDITGTYRKPDGTTGEFRFTHDPTNDRVAKAELFRVGEGYLETVLVRPSTGVPRLGGLYLTVDLVRGLSTAQLSLAQLLGGLASNQQGLGWPGSPIVHSLAGPGIVRNLLLTAPGAGLDWSQTVPAGALWELVAVASTLTTSAIAGTRRVALFVTDQGGNVLQWSDQPLLTGPSTVGSYAWFQGAEVTSDAVYLHSTAPLARLLTLRANDIFRVGTLGLDAGDAWDAPRIAIREWLEAN